MSRIRHAISFAAALICLVGGAASADPSGSLQGLYTATESVFRLNFFTNQWQNRLVRTYYFFYPDGRVYYGLPLGGLNRFDFDRAQQEQPNQRGRYQIAGGQIQLDFPGQNGSSSRAFQAGQSNSITLGRLTYTRVDRGYDGLTLDGSYGMSNFTPTWSGGTGFLGNVSSDRSISFTRDGRFYEQNFVGSVIGTPDSRTGIVSSTRSAGAGTYRIGGNAIELTYADGQRLQFTFFHYSENSGETRPELIAIDGAHLLRRGDPVIPVATGPQPAPNDRPADGSADAQPVLGLRAGQIAEIQVQAGDAEAARQVAGLFVNAVHLYLDNGMMAIVTPDMKELIALCQFQYDPQTERVSFQSQANDLQVMGLLALDNDGTPYTATRVQVGGTAPLDVLFLQPMEVTFRK